MCGIAGILCLSNERPVGLDELRRMCAVMTHRGPDDEGLHAARGAGLAMRRLSILDLVNGQQPVENEDGSVRVVLNGEIYNFQALRMELEARGHRFRSRTDTETIVHLYEEEGIDCVHRLRGMFAFALWDSRREELLVARDRIGIKPLYYAEVDGRLAFASELKSLLELPAVERAIDWGAFRSLLAAGVTPIDRSIIRGVRKLPPGHRIVASRRRGVVLEKYWDLDFEPDYGRREEAVVEELRWRLEEAVRLHMVSDVPVGAFLSGGVDSSAVAAIMSRFARGPIQTFSIGFREPDFDESGDARRVAERLGTEHHELVLQPDPVAVIDELPWHLDEPFADSSAIPTFMVSKLAAGHVKVALSGDGGDELFAGYDKYVVERRERRYDRVPLLLRRAAGTVARRLPDGARGKNFLRHASLSALGRYLDACTLFPDDEVDRLLKPEILERVSEERPWAFETECLQSANRDWLSSLQYLDFKSYLPLDILTKVDRTSMAHSLEVRVPLLDHELVEFAARITPGLKLHRSTRKYVFKRALAGLVPPEVLDRPKRGFAVPLGAWFRGELTSVLRDVLVTQRSRERGLWRPERIETLLRRHQQGRALDHQLWLLLSFELWCRRFLDGEGERQRRRREARTNGQPCTATLS